MTETGIEWTDYTSNPVKYRDRTTGDIVWACVKTSPGCANCYAETLAKRYGRGGPFTNDRTAGVDCFFCDKEAGRLLRDKKLAGKRVFIGDMTDVFGPWVPDAVLDRLFAIFVLRPDVTFQVLTKRASRMREYLTGDHLADRLHEAVKHRVGYDAPSRPAVNRSDLPLRNVWLGVSTEDQQRADERLTYLINTPAAVRFISAEPLLGAVRLQHDFDGKLVRNWLGTGGVNWVIVGGESGPDSRTCRVEWVGSLVSQCRAAGVPCFVKQLGARVTTRLEPSEAWPGHTGPTSRVQFSGDGFGNYFVGGLVSRKGGEMTEWPAALRVRQFPA